MRVRAAGLMLAASCLGAACANPLGREYEYEEQVYLSVNGAATVIVDASIASLVALRGLPLDPSFVVRPDRTAIRTLVEAGGCPSVTVGQPWSRRGRRYIQIRVSTEDIRRLGSCALLAWSTYSLEDDGPETLEYRQVVGPSAGGHPGDVDWTGHEIVGFKLHLPSRITFHNVKRLADGRDGGIERGNILTYEQTLADRRAGLPLEMHVVMGAQSILFRTLLLFGLAFGAAVAVLVGGVWMTMRRAKRKATWRSEEVGSEEVKK